MVHKIVIWQGRRALRDIDDIVIMLIRRRLLILLSGGCEVKGNKGIASAVPDTNDPLDMFGSESAAADLLAQVRRRDGGSRRIEVSLKTS